VIEVVGSAEFEAWFLGLIDADARAVARGVGPWRREVHLWNLDGVPQRAGRWIMKSWKDIRDKKFSAEEQKAIDQEVEGELLEMDLRTLREAAGLTQEELAAKVEITQSQLSKLERREDHRISTLRRYVKALGGELEVIAVVHGKRIKLAEG
jgi:DNA-binding XRE family transcriptional regulator